MTFSIVPRGCAFSALLSLLVLALAEPGSSQGRSTDDLGSRGESAEAGRGYFQVGYLNLDMDELNGRLAGAGYPALGEDFLTLGGGGMGHVGDRFVVGGGGQAILGRAVTGAGGAYQVSAGGGYGLFRVGYEAYSRGKLDVIPAIGIGGGGLNLDLTERGAPNFDEVLDDPARSASLSTGMFLLDASVAVSYRVRGPEAARSRDEPGGMLFGVEAGYTFAPGSTAWNLDEINTVADGPLFQIEGLYVRASIGGWGGDDAREDRRRRR